LINLIFVIFVLYKFIYLVIIISSLFFCQPGSETASTFVDNIDSSDSLVRFIEFQKHETFELACFSVLGSSFVGFPQTHVVDLVKQVSLICIGVESVDKHCLAACSVWVRAAAPVTTSPVGLSAAVAAAPVASASAAVASASKSSLPLLFIFVIFHLVGISNRPHDGIELSSLAELEFALFVKERQVVGQVVLVHVEVERVFVFGDDHTVDRFVVERSLVVCVHGIGEHFVEETFGLDFLVDLNLEGLVVGRARNHAAGRHVERVVHPADHAQQTGHEFAFVLLLVDDFVALALKHLNDLFIDVVLNRVQVAGRVAAHRSHYVQRLGRALLLKLEFAKLLDLVNHLLGLLGVESDARAFPAHAPCAAAAVHVTLDILGRLDLDDEVEVWQVDAASHDVGGEQHHYLVLPEEVHGDFTLLLRDVSVEYAGFGLDFVDFDDVVDHLLFGAEDDALGVLACVDEADVGNHLVQVGVGALHFDMSDFLGHVGPPSHDVDHLLLDLELLAHVEE